MNCIHCNAELPEGAKVCEYCDCTTEAGASGKAKTIILSILYALASFLLIFMPSIGRWITGDISRVYEKITTGQYGSAGSVVAAYTLLTNIMSRLDSLVFPAAGLMLGVAALAISLRKKGACKAALVSGIAGLAAVGYSLIMAVLVPACPEILISSMTVDVNAIAAASAITAGEPVFILRYIIVLLLTSGVTVPVFILAIKARKTAEPEISGRMVRSIASLMTFLPLINFALSFRNLITNYYTGTMGSNALAANSMADTAVASVLSISPFVLLIITVYCVLMKKFRYPLFVLPGLGALITYGIIALCSGDKLIRAFIGGDGPIYSMAADAIVPKMLGTLFLLAALYFWVAATARGNVRAWGQIIFAFSVINIILIAEAIKVGVFKMVFSFPLAELILGFAILSAAIPLSIRNREK